MNHAAILGPGRIGRQIALAFALGGSRVSLVDVKERPAGGAAAVFAEARREIQRDLGLMAEEGVIEPGEIAPALERIEEHTGLHGLGEPGLDLGEAAGSDDVPLAIRSGARLGLTSEHLAVPR